MASYLSPDHLERIAHKRAATKLGWYIHAAVYLVVNVFLVLSTYAFGRRPWPALPLLAWGLALALHGVAVFMLGDGSSFRRHLLERERKRLRREQDRMPRS